MITTPFWYKNPSILYEKDSIFEFFPSRRFDIVRKLNAILRLSIIYSLIMYLCTKNNIYLIISPIVAIVTWFLWNRQTDTHTDTILEESMSNKIDDLIQINDLETECRVPTKENPFMNPPLFEFGNEHHQQPKSCPSYNI